MDIVIPYHPKDGGTINECLDSIKLYVNKYRNIFIISNKNHNFKDTIWINLDNFPFDGNSVINFHGKTPKNGWYLQQLIKLYSVICIPNISNTICVIDSDIVFCNTINLYETDINKPNLNIQYDVIKGHAQWGPDYFIHMKKLHPELERIDPNITGINQVFSIKKSTIINLFKLVETYHNNNLKFWELFLHFAEGTKSGASEFEILINYILKFELNEYNLVKWVFGLAKIDKHNVLCSQNNILYFKNKEWKYIQFQSHMRGIRHHNYKNICIKCGLETKDNHICDETETNKREVTNIIK